ncbi:hypothetical protein MKX01_012517, partial [Papaver californicum]
ENDLLELVPLTQIESLLGKRSFSDINNENVNEISEKSLLNSGLFHEVVNQNLSRVQEKPDFTFEFADDHFSYSEKDETFFTPPGEIPLNQDYVAPAFKISFSETPDSIHEVSSLGSNCSVQVTDQVVDQKINLEFNQYRSFINDAMALGEMEAINPVFESKGAENKAKINTETKKGIQVNKPFISKSCFAFFNLNIDNLLIDR